MANYVITKPIHNYKKNNQKQKRGDVVFEYFRCFEGCIEID